MKNTIYSTLVSPKTYRYIHESLNVILRIPITVNFYTRQITDMDIVSYHSNFSFLIVVVL